MRHRCWYHGGMAQHATYEDVNLILRLYDMRREDKMRIARAWFASNFKPASLDELMKEFPMGSEANAHMRQVVSYWEMVASFMTSDVLNKDLYFQSGQELLMVWTRLKPVIAQMRVAYNNPGLYANLEAVSNEYIAFMNAKEPTAYAAFEKRINGMVK